MIRNLSLNTILLYNIFILLFYIWFMIKYRKSGVSLLIITFFFAGIFSDTRYFIGSTSIFNVYKIIVFVWALLLFAKYVNHRLINRYRNVILVFIVFSLYFFTSSLFIHQDRIMLAFSQWSKYVIPLMLLFVLANKMKDNGNTELFNKLFGTLIISQIILSVVKLLIIRQNYEGLVGSITGLTGGGQGTTLPILGMIWLVVNDRLHLKGKNVWLLIGLLFIGIMTGKRAVLFLFPLYFVLFNFFVVRKRSILQALRVFLVILLISPAFVYLGFRLSPTLNPDNKVWGRFDLQYAINYALYYSAGITSYEGQIQKGIGRIGAVSLIWESLIHPNKNTPIFIQGNGFEYFTQSGEENYYNEKYFYGITSKGSVTGFVQFVLTIGLIGTVLFMLYLFMLIKTIVSYKKFRYMLFLIVFIDFIFYNSTIVQVHALSILLIFFMLFSHTKYTTTAD